MITIKLFKGMTNKQELTILSEFFKTYPNILKWKIEFNVLTTSFLGGTGFGLSSIVVGINQLPTNGFCSIYPQSGFSDNTIFSIRCSNWTDPDGFITRIEYYGKLQKNNFSGFFF